MKYWMCLGLLGALVGAGCAQGEAQDAVVADRGVAAARPVASPDGRVVFDVRATPRALQYRIRFDDAVVVDWSDLGLRFAEHAGLDAGLRFDGGRPARLDATWEQPWGERREVRDHHNEFAYDIVRDDGDAAMTLRVRVFDDGVGFRYEVPDLPGETVVVDEITTFTLDRNATSWTIPARKWNRYEYLYRELPVGELEMVHTPATFELPSGTHVAIHEAALVDYSGMSLDRQRDGVLEANLAPRGDGRGKVVLDGAVTTPWRVIQIADDAVGLVNSDIILNLNAPNALPDYDFQPGKYAGIWWEQHIRDKTWGQVEGARTTYHGATTAHMKSMMDFAAENDFLGVLVEGWNTGWDDDWFNNGDVFSFTQTYDDFDLDAVSDYGRRIGTRMIGHHETSGNLSNYEMQLDDALDLMAEHDVRLIKTGYVADGGNLKVVGADGVVRYEYHDGQVAVDHHMKVVRAAAARGIAINAHEPVKDTGLRRTYPNWVTREGARGQEFNAWGVPPNGPDHVADLVFTRMLSGPMDYTAGAFDLRPSEKPPAGPDFPRNDPRSRIEHTLAKELALYVVLYSPVQMVIDLPEEYAKRPKAFQFIRDVPTDWAESIALDGAVGDFVTIARKDRNSEDWYLATVTDGDARDVDVDLSFLEDGRYEAQIYADADGADYETAPYAIDISSREVTAQDAMAFALGRSGGAVVRFRKL